MLLVTAARYAETEHLRLGWQNMSFFPSPHYPPVMLIMVLQTIMQWNDLTLVYYYVGCIT